MLLFTNENVDAYVQKHAYIWHLQVFLYCFQQNQNLITVLKEKRWDHNIKVKYGSNLNIPHSSLRVWGQGFILDW